MISPYRAEEPAPGARQLARGITATWWYTVTAVAVFEAILIAAWTSLVVRAGASLMTTLLIGLGGLVWVLSTVLLLIAYGHRGDFESPLPRVQVAALIGVAVAYGAAAGTATGSWSLALVPLAQSLVLVDWPAGIRSRILSVATIALACLAITDGVPGASVADREWWVLAYTVLVPVMTVSSLWWWDVLVVLDRARASEVRLAATQERLRVATDVHDLQGHHLQVIALQLELAERLHTGDPETALAHLQAARTSVGEARQGTRDLATRFRSVPLGDELANARDLLTAAGLAVDAHIAPDADLAPAADLGPVIRETTTNVLRHGGGHRARLALSRDPQGWRYAISNDAPFVAAGGDGSGLDGIRRRITEAGGTIDVQRGDEFTVTVTVPDIEWRTR